MKSKIIIEKARKSDYNAILKVMEPWNMHHIPSPEMEEIDLNCFFVARIGRKIVGASGYRILSQTLGKTTLLGVLPEYGQEGIGRMLQDARLRTMFRLGVKKVITNADRPQTIKWYKKHFGYREVGTLKKVSSFGDDNISHWTTLEMDLTAYMKKQERKLLEQEYIKKNEPHPLAPYPPLVINVCLTGMVPNKDSTIFVPVTPEEIAEDAIKVFDAGARIVHLHARDSDGNPTWKAKTYEKILDLIRMERPELICCVSTSGRDWPEFEKRAEVLHIKGKSKPDMASLTLGSLNFISGASVNSIEMVEKLALTMKKNKIKPELEVFDTGMISLAKYLERKDVITGPKYFNLLLGNINNIPATIGHLHSLVNDLPENSFWAAAGLGMFQLPMNICAIVAGGGVRVGLEDNILYDHTSKKLASNTELVKRIVRISGELERSVASPLEARQLIGLEVE
ncbi:MAG: GNAT family N-acetyltransferase [Bacteroidales bacterium]|nr:GNAT family N-acetyltransferase [Bacteroidales bacterium]